MDTGHQQSATACGAYGLTAKGNVILLDTFYYSPAGQVVKKAPSELTVMVSNFIDKVLKQYRVPKLRMTIDSAEGALRNQYFKDFGERWHPVAKKKNQTMIDMVISLLLRGVSTTSTYQLTRYSTRNTRCIDTMRKRYILMIQK